MNKDRGTIKWNALMLPEHVKLLREWQAEEQWIAKPEIEQWQLEEMNHHLQAALTQQLFVHIKKWNNGTIISFTSKIKKYNPAVSMISFQNGEQITMEQLIAVEAIYD